MSAAARRSVATGVRTSGSAPDGLSAWQAASRSPAHDAGTPYCPGNVGISDTMIRVTLGLVLSMRTATVRPEPPTRHVCANTGRNNELTNNSGQAWALAFVRSPLFARAVCFVLPIVVSFFVSKTFSFRFRSCAAVNNNNHVNELKNELKSRILLFFRAGCPLGGDP